MKTTYTPKLLLETYREHVKQRDKELRKPIYARLFAPDCEEPVFIETEHKEYWDLLRELEGPNGERAMDRIVEGELPYVVDFAVHKGGMVAIHVARLRVKGGG